MASASTPGRTLPWGLAVCVSMLLLSATASAQTTITSCSYSSSTLTVRGALTTSAAAWVLIPCTLPAGYSGFTSISVSITNSRGDNYWVFLASGTAGCTPPDSTSEPPAQYYSSSIGTSTYDASITASSGVRSSDAIACAYIYCVDAATTSCRPDSATVTFEGTPDSSEMVAGCSVSSTAQIPANSGPVEYTCALGNQVGSFSVMGLNLYNPAGDQYAVYLASGWGSSSCSAWPNTPSLSYSPNIIGTSLSIINAATFIESTDNQACVFLTCLLPTAAACAPASLQIYFTGQAASPVAVPVTGCAFSNTSWTLPAGGLWWQWSCPLGSATSFSTMTATLTNPASDIYQILLASGSDCDVSSSDAGPAHYYLDASLAANTNASVISTSSFVDSGASPSCFFIYCENPDGGRHCAPSSVTIGFTAFGIAGSATVVSNVAGVRPALPLVQPSLSGHATVTPTLGGAATVTLSPGPSGSLAGQQSYTATASRSSTRQSSGQSSQASGQSSSQASGQSSSQASGQSSSQASATATATRPVSPSTSPGAQCKQYAACATCAADPACGWCGAPDNFGCQAAATGLAATGAPGPAVGTCAGWRSSTAQCSACSAFSSCSTCSATAGCGWCASAGAWGCTAGTAAGATAGACPSTGWQYYNSQCSACSGAASCTACAATAACGWCGDPGNSSCFLGAASGPTAGSCKQWDYVSTQCPPPAISSGLGAGGGSSTLTAQNITTSLLAAIASLPQTTLIAITTTVAACLSVVIIVLAVVILIIFLRRRQASPFTSATANKAVSEVATVINPARSRSSFRNVLTPEASETLSHAASTRRIQVSPHDTSGTRQSLSPQPVRTAIGTAASAVGIQVSPHDTSGTRQSSLPQPVRTASGTAASAAGFFSSLSGLRNSFKKDITEVAGAVRTARNGINEMSDAVHTFEEGVHDVRQAASSLRDGGGGFFGNLTKGFSEMSSALSTGRKGVSDLSDAAHLRS